MPTNLSSLKSSLSTQNITKHVNFLHEKSVKNYIFAKVNLHDWANCSVKNGVNFWKVHVRESKVCLMKKKAKAKYIGRNINRIAICGYISIILTGVRELFIINWAIFVQFHL